MAKASAATGGRASSYAVTAASQAADYYKSQLTDKQQALYDAAYQRYYQDYAQKLNLAQTLQAQDESRYNRWNDEYTNLLNRLGVLQNQEQSDYSRWYTERTNAYNNLVSLIASTGYTPSEAELALAGMSSAEAAAWRSYYTRSLSSGSSSGRYYGGSPDSDEGETTLLQDLVSLANTEGYETARQALTGLKAAGYTTIAEQSALNSKLASSVSGVDTSSWREFAQNTYANLYRSKQKGKETAASTKSYLQNYVKNGWLTQSEANKIYNSLW